MSQFLAQVPRQVLRQEQRLTPQLIQAMDILQLPLAALESRIDQELDSNPALEDAVQEDPAAADEAGRADASELGPGTDQSAEEFDRLDRLVREYDYLDEDDDRYRANRSRASAGEDSDFKLEAMSNAASRPQGLQDQLLEQWGLFEVDDRVRRLGELLISRINDHGRIEEPLVEIAAAADPPATEPELGVVLQMVQTLEPPGIAARSLQESLLIQLRLLGDDTELAEAIVRDHFDDLQKNRLPQIARATDVDLDEVKSALALIGRLSLNPAAEITQTATPFIVPDVIVEFDEENDRYDVRLARGNTRDLRISDEFRAALEKSRDDKAARDFMKQKLEAANALLDALRFRRERLLEVARYVVEAQRDFLDYGEQHLKVLRMADLAQHLSCDPSTISRTVDEKYLQTPRGVYPLRRFFTGGTENQSGEAIGWDSIKAKVAEIVVGEDKRDPLNDDQIVERLQTQGIDIKRRTVAKYRDQLGIPTARQRKQF